MTAATAAALLAVTACGGSGNGVTAMSSASGYDAAFTARANAVCSVAVARHAGHPFPVPDFDPLHPKAADLPAVGSYLARYGAGSAVAAQLDALAPGSAPARMAAAARPHRSGGRQQPTADHRSRQRRYSAGSSGPPGTPRRCLPASTGLRRYSASPPLRRAPRSSDEWRG
ncbi:hypothetical protein EAS64_42625 [Trebonia kvetii]|uniref:Uncharacterized protein n=1 Tax=Trebonia kvetii TaxID=2480626 RepID=A0A6P2BLL9_9ACTN|nr:hypothetical protein [Trebonia kvetii]TVY98955.1 hypothetical protein EAS64_42625 [Trebonia kvetii]